MQGKKITQEKLFTNFQLSEHVPQDNFYRRLKSILDLQFVRPLTKEYYGSCGQDSIDPEVFFKICLVGYLENIISDRKLISHSSMRLDILFFLGYDIGEALPWHSTISRTRQLFGELVFEAVFTQVLSQCIESGMVSGHSQVIDSAPVKANASMDSLELKVPAQDLKAHLAEVRHISHRDKDNYRKAKNDKSDNHDKRITASKAELTHIDSRQRKWSKEQTERPGAGNKGSRYTSNKTHYSPVDPDARISVKPGKARKLNYNCQLAVDSSHHVISYIGAYYADKKDNQDLEDIVKKTKRQLWREGLDIENIFADTGYSSGENYAFLERQNLKGYIPLHGTYKGGPEGFTYVKSEDYFICPEGEVVPFKKVFLDHRTKTKKKEYRTSSLQCKGCALASSCLGKTAKEKKFSVTYYRAEYERTKARLKTKLGKQSKSIRQSRVEPVFGTLTQYMGLRKVNVRGIQGANKCMLMAAVAYNLKKLLKFRENLSKSKAQRIGFVRFLKNAYQVFVSTMLSTQKISIH